MLQGLFAFKAGRLARCLPDDFIRLFLKSLHRTDSQIGPVALDQPVQAFHADGMQKVVAVHIGDIVALRRQRARVARRGQTAVFAMNRPHARVPPGVILCQAAAAIRRTVVHQNHIQPVIGLRQHAVHTQRHLRFHTVKRDDNGNQRFGHLSAPPAVILSYNRSSCMPVWRTSRPARRTASTPPARSFCLSVRSNAAHHGSGP